MTVHVEFLACELGFWVTPSNAILVLYEHLVGYRFEESVLFVLIVLLPSLISLPYINILMRVSVSAAVKNCSKFSPLPPPLR